MKWNLYFFIVVILLVAFLGCQKLPENKEAMGNLKKVEILKTDYIPLEYGKLLSVTAHGQYEGWAQLWFQAEDETIRMVRVNFHTDRIHEDVLVIPRK